MVQSSLQLPAPSSSTAYCDVSLEKDKQLSFLLTLSTHMTLLLLKEAGLTKSWSVSAPQLEEEYESSQLEGDTETFCLQVTSEDMDVITLT